jgi:beta-galactosidase
MFFYHALVWGDNKPTELFTYRIHYQDGTHEDFKIVNGRQNGDWRESPSKEEKSKIVVTKLIRPHQGPDLRYLRIVEWINPHPENAIRSMDILKEQQADFTPILIAVTGETME